MLIGKKITLNIKSVNNLRYRWHCQHDLGNAESNSNYRNTSSTLLNESMSSSNSESEFNLGRYPIE